MTSNLALSIAPPPSPSRRPPPPPETPLALRAVEVLYDGPRTLATSAAASRCCPHPADARTRVTIPDSPSPETVRHWCGMCGAMGASDPGSEDIDWTRPTFVSDVGLAEMVDHEFASLSAREIAACVDILLRDRTSTVEQLRAQLCVLRTAARALCETDSVAAAECLGPAMAFVAREETR